MAKKQATGWAGLDEAGFLDSDLLILGDDGDAACFVLMGEPELDTEKASFGTVTRAVVPVVRCGDAEPEPMETWHVQALRMAKGQTRSIRAAAEGYEGKRMLRMTRHGAKGDTKTRYSVEIVDPEIPANMQERCAELLAESEK